MPYNKLADYHPSHLGEILGKIDIYWLDQLLKGNIDLTRPILDAGCGGGRNSVYLMRLNCPVYGVDTDPDCIAGMNTLVQNLSLPDANRFLRADLDRLPFEDAFFGSIICNAVLHFARDFSHFEAMLRELWRVLEPEGIFVARFATTIGLENRLQKIANKEGWYLLPDQTERFLVAETDIMKISVDLKGEMYEPLKTTLVQNMRSMTTWLLRKPPVG